MKILCILKRKAGTIIAKQRVLTQQTWEGIIQGKTISIPKFSN